MTMMYRLKPPFLSFFVASHRRSVAIGFFIGVGFLHRQLFASADFFLSSSAPVSMPATAPKRSTYSTPSFMVTTASPSLETMSYESPTGTGRNPLPLQVAEAIGVGDEIFIGLEIGAHLGRLAGDIDDFQLAERVFQIVELDRIQLLVVGEFDDFRLLVFVVHQVLEVPFLIFSSQVRSASER